MGRCWRAIRREDIRQSRNSLSYLHLIHWIRRCTSMSDKLKPTLAPGKVAQVDAHQDC